MTANRFLTSHVGSLPRPEQLVQLMFAKEEGLRYDAAALQAAVKDGVRAVVDLQVKAGIDIVNDGEWSKPSYSTYIKERLEGLDGSATTFTFQDIEQCPSTKKRVIAQRIGRYADLVGRDNVIAATDCGFSIYVGSEDVD